MTDKRTRAHTHTHATAHLANLIFRGNEAAECDVGFEGGIIVQVNLIHAVALAKVGSGEVAAKCFGRWKLMNAVTCKHTRIHTDLADNGVPCDVAGTHSH